MHASIINKMKCNKNSPNFVSYHRRGYALTFGIIVRFSDPFYTANHSNVLQFTKVKNKQTKTL